MASQNLKQRTKDEEPTPTTTTTNKQTTTTTANKKKMAMAKRGLRSLSIAIVIPLLLTFITIYFFKSGENYYNLKKPFWFPSLWVLHTGYIVSSLLMGLSGWLVWAEGGFHKHPSAVPLYLGQLLLSLSWYPLVFKAGASWSGLFVCIGLFTALFGCSKRFREVNPIAGDLVKPCLAWVAYLTLVNFKLVHL